MSELFKGKTKLHFGKNHTFNDLADAILDTVTKVEAEILIMVMQQKMTEPRFLKQQEELEKFKKEHGIK